MPAIIAFIFLFNFLLCTFAFADTPSPMPTQSDESVQTPDSPTANQSDSIQKVLNGLSVDKSSGPHTHAFDDGTFVLYGNLFKTGEIYALVTVGDTVGFSKRAEEKWKIISQWKIWCVWRPENWKRDDDETHFPIRPTTTPFQLQDFDGDGIPEVIIAGDVAKYYQEYYLFRFDSETKTLMKLDEAMAEPKLCGGYVRLYYNWGRRAIFDEWRFKKIVGDHLEEIAMWHDGCPYHAGDNEGPRTEWRDEKGNLKYCQWNTGLQDTPIDTYILESRDRKPMGSLEFKPKKEVSLAEQNQIGSMEDLWLFHHFTGLPVTLYPENIDESIKVKDPIKMLIKLENVKITGDSDLLEHLKSVKD